MMGQYPYPIWNTPKMLIDKVTDICQGTDIDTPSAATTMLTSLSLAASTLYEVENEPGFVTPLALYSIVVAESGYGKLKLYTNAVEPFTKYEMESAELKANNQIQIDGKRVVWDEQKKDLLFRYRKVLKHKEHESAIQLEQEIKQHETKKPIESKIDRILLSDSTPSGLKHFFAGTGVVGGIFLPEAGILFNAKKGLSEPELLCNLYDGTSSHVDRRNGDSLSIIGPATSMLGFIPNDIFQTFYSKHGVELISNGLFQRMLFCFTEQNSGADTYMTYFHDKPCQGELQSLISTFLAEHSKLKNSPDRKKRRLRPSPEAAQFCQEVKHQLRIDTQPKRPLENFKGFAAKYTNNMMRIAGLFHLMEGREGDIKRDSVEQANGICYWHLQQAMMYFDENRKLEVKADQLYIWFSNELTKRGVSYLEKIKLYQYLPSRFRGRGKSDVQPLLDILVAKQLLVIEKLRGIGTIVKKPHLEFGF